MNVHERLIPSRADLVAKRWLSPLRPYLADDGLWELNRQSVARAVAIGLFVGLLVPIAQFVAAVVLAVVLRGHIAISAACTMISNPLTFPPIYWLAYQIGSRLLPGAHLAAALPGPGTPPTGLAWLWETAKVAGAPVLLGLVLMAVCGAVLGYASVWLLWRPEPEASRPAD